MINHILSSAGGDSQSPRERVPFQESAPEGLKPEPDENILNLLKIMSRDIRSSLLSMLGTLKLLNRGYYGKMDEEVSTKIKDLLVKCHSAYHHLGRIFGRNFCRG